MTTIPLRVEFDGLTSLVPMKALADPNPAKRWLAALPDLSRVLSSGKLPQPVAPHVSVVVVAQDAVVPIGTNKAPSLIFQSPRFRDRIYHLYSLDGDRLRFSLGIPPAQRLLNPKLTNFGSAEEPPNPGDAEDLAWVTPMNEMQVADAYKFNKELLDGDRPNTNWANAPSQPPIGLAGTVLLDHGDLSTDGVVTYLDGGVEKNGVYEFKPTATTPKVHRQSQVDHIVLTAAVDRPTVTLAFRRGQRRQRVEILPIDGIFRVWVFDLELEDVLGIGSSSGTGHQDPDFAVSYALSAGWSGISAPLPIPFPDWPEAGGGRKTCNPSRFGGW